VPCYEIFVISGGEWEFPYGVRGQIGRKTSGLMERPELHRLAIGAIAADFCARDGDFNLAIAFDLFLQLFK
jgi:hypothetical protein